MTEVMESATEQSTTVANDKANRNRYTNREASFAKALLLYGLGYQEADQVFRARFPEKCVGHKTNIIATISRSCQFPELSVRRKGWWCPDQKRRESIRDAALEILSKHNGPIDDRKFLEHLGKEARIDPKKISRATKQGFNDRFPSRDEKKKEDAKVVYPACFGLHVKVAGGTSVSCSRCSYEDDCMTQTKRVFELKESIGAVPAALAVVFPERSECSQKAAEVQKQVVEKEPETEPSSLVMKQEELIFPERSECSQKDESLQKRIVLQIIALKFDELSPEANYFSDYGIHQVLKPEYAHLFVKGLRVISS